LPEHWLNPCVCEALKVLEWAGALTWQNRITRTRVAQRDVTCSPGGRPGGQ
jgi:hypothetical protein